MNIGDHTGPTTLLRVDCLLKELQMFATYFNNKPVQIATDNTAVVVVTL